MQVKDLITDIIVTGIPALLWFGLLVCGFSVRDEATASDLRTVLTKETYLLPVLIPFAYALGIIVDRLSDSVVAPIDRKLRKSIFRDKAEEYGREVPKAYLMRMAVYEKGGMVAEFVNYQRSRIRVARANVLNFALLTASLTFFLCRVQSTPVHPLFALSTGIGLTALTGWTWYRISEAYYKRLIDGYFQLFQLVEQPWI